MEKPEDITAHLATRLRSLRLECGLTLDGLAARTGVSRSMISLIERGESNPTAAVLDRLAAGLGVTLSALFAERRHAAAPPLVRRSDQVSWRDPESGYLRRNLSPPGHPSPIELAEVVLPPGCRVAYDAGPGRSGVSQQIWIIEGEVTVAVGDEIHHLTVGDCLAMNIDRPNVFHNPAGAPTRYLVALVSGTPRPNSATARLEEPL